MITQILPIAAGNAMQIFIAPSKGWEKWMVLRKPSDTFTGYNDPGAYVVSENDYGYVVDITGLANGSQYFYRDYGWNGTEWVDSGASMSGTPAPNYADTSTDVLNILRERISQGLQVEIAAGNLFHDSNIIPVLLASPTFEGTKWPIISLHVAGDNSSGNQFIGGMGDADFLDTDTGLIEETDGWLSQYQITIVGWTLNADERYAIKKAIKRILIANKAVFDYAGMINLEVSQQNVDDFESYPAPVYQIHTQLSFVAPSTIKINYQPITAVNVTSICYGDKYV